MGNESAKKIRGHDDLLPGEEVVDACDGLGQGFLKNVLAVGFTDGSIGGLHVPRAEHPSDFVTALNAVVDPEG